MELWSTWWSLIREFRICFSRTQTFLWFIVIQIGFIIKRDKAGVSSFIRCLGLKEKCYNNLLAFFHSSSINLKLIVEVWLKIILKTGLSYMVNNRLIIIADGVKTPKEGKKMPAVKSLHQESESNSKPEYIMGHSFQVISLLASVGKYFFAIPLIARIHEGIITSNRLKKTLLDKLVDMFFSMNISSLCYFVVDAYYASKKIILPMLAAGHHIISRVKSNAVAYQPIEVKPTLKKPKKRGRPKRYGKKVSLKEILKDTDRMEEVTAEIYGEKATFLICTMDLFWRTIGQVVRFVFIVHPTKGSAIFLSTDCSLSGLEIVKIYSLRFKIEVSFKSAIQNIGVFTYHFWMRNMAKIYRCSGNQYLHRKSKKYRSDVYRKIAAYHNYVQFGLIAQGILQIISMMKYQVVWKFFGSWVRTIRPNVLPSENIVMEAFKQTASEFLKGNLTTINLEKFILNQIDLNRTEGQRLVA